MECSYEYDQSCILCQKEYIMTIKLMSFNTQHCLHYITRQIDFDAFVEEIRKHNADIIGLNEMRDQGKAADYQAQTRILAEKLGYYHYFAKASDVNDVNPYGNAILSRFPIIFAETIMIPDPVEKTGKPEWYETRCLLKAKIDVCGGLDVCVTHFGLNLDEQENAVETVVENIGKEKCVLMGDFNVTPDNPLLEAIKEKMYDTAVLFTEDLKSWPSDEPTVKIDYVFTSHDLKVLSADIPADVVSDHRPYVVEIAKYTKIASGQ